MVILDIGYFTLLEISDICPVRVLTTVTKWCSCIYISYRRRLKNKSNLGYGAEKCCSAQPFERPHRQHRKSSPNSCVLSAFHRFPRLPATPICEDGVLSVLIRNF